MSQRNHLTLNNLCVAIIGETPPHILAVLSAAGVETSQIHSIPFVEASTRSEWQSWKKSLDSSDFGIGSGSGGCLLAHHDAWRTWENCQHEFLLVLEDDVIFTRYGGQYFESVLDQLVSSDLSLLHLGDHTKYDLRILTKMFFALNVREIFKFIYERLLLKFFSPRFASKQFPYSGHAYILRTDLAKILTQESENFLYPVDVHLNAISQVAKNKVAKVRTPILIQANERLSHIKQRGR